MIIKKVFVLLISTIIKLVHAKTQPHIVLILADDVGWNDASFHGSNQIQTPNIDALGYNGVILNRFYTLPICTPSRTALLTGQYPMRAGLQGTPIIAGENRHLPLNIPLLPERLKELGYSTNLVGKWHLGAAYKNVTPTSRGFDYHFGYWHGYVGYFGHNARGEDMVGLDMHDGYQSMWQTQGEYATSLFSRKAEEVIANHESSKPLFLMVSHLAGHTGTDQDLEVPDLKKNDKTFGYIADEKRRLYAGVMNELDVSVGKIVDALSKKGILDNTIVLFLSDNGAQTEGVHENRGSNWPLRGLKFSLHDGGVRNLAVMYSSLLKNKSVVNEELMHITDLLPTLYAAAGGDVNDLGKIDGVNQWDTLIWNEKSKRNEILLNIDELDNSSGLIGESGRFKIINGSTVYDGSYERFYGEDGRDRASPRYNTEAVLRSSVNIALGKTLTVDQVVQLRTEADLGNCRTSQKESSACIYNTFCLFDLFNDPCETTNVAEDFPEILNKLKRRLGEYWKEIVPQQIAPVDPKANPSYCNGTWYTWLDNHCVIN